MCTLLSVLLVRVLTDFLSAIPNSYALQIEICKELIEWSTQEKRIFLRQNLEARLIAMYEIFLQIIILNGF